MLQTIKQAMNRTKQRFQETFRKGQKTVDDEYTQFKEEYKDMEKHYYKIHRAIKRYHDGLRTMAMANEELSQEIKNFYQPGAPFEKQAGEFADILSQMQNGCLRAVDARFQDEVLKPTTQVMDVIEEMKKTLEIRHRWQLEFDYYRNKLRELVEKGTDAERIQRNQEKMAERKATYEEWNLRATAEIAQLAEARYKMFDYSFFTLMMTLEDFYASTARSIKPVRRFEDQMPDKWIFKERVASTEAAAAALADASRPSKSAGSPGASAASMLKRGSDSASDSIAGAAVGASGIGGGLMGSVAKSAVSSAVKAKLAAPTAAAASMADSMTTSAAAGVQGFRKEKQPKGVRTVASYDYAAQEDGEVTLHEGDIIIVTEPDVDGWSTGYNTDTHKTGLFPSAYVQPAPAEEEPDSFFPNPPAEDLMDFMNSTPPPPPPQAVAPPPKQAVAVAAPPLPARVSGPALPAKPASPSTPVLPTKAPATATPPAKVTPPTPVQPVPSAPPASPVATAVASAPALKPTPKPQPAPPAAAPAAATAAKCGTCACDAFLPHPFKKGQCSNCFHTH